MLHVLMAWILLTSPVDAPTEGCWLYAEDIKEFALEIQILDPREVRFMLTKAEDAEADLRLLRRRYCQLHDAPPLWDAERFPGHCCVREMLLFNRGYRAHLEARKAIEPLNADFIQVVIDETDELYRIWDLVSDARCEYYYITVRRDALKKLRSRIGEAAYNFSEPFPPHVPLWRFKRID